MSSPGFTVAIAISAATGQTDRRLMGTHSHLLKQISTCSPTLLPQTLQAKEEAPTEEQKAFPKGPHRLCTLHNATSSEVSIVSMVLAAPAVTTVFFTHIHHAFLYVLSVTAV
ncbi:uncharacterized protein MONOS_5415 [Monocercomonoides exilis]|uniref:uncharacterized protein n=1 Tax=Monocercomonoides exilis TaxID=2049356 RepID=UPI00355ABCCC|nr:hypothetical protein MONOS_5415 [Monocercomonoides exilis]|eukprot:MONOS_5415.1-p1 / transcript=MONOS_5415.1 / gene=MONOS_5415 / organism=Monocercomonoides_exilis_PA203 / gene_product=unspecified product / transcript_product=unspecified product / location=Mono_scaffold00157:33504-33839(-) / protein_length=112 / sequence_SO=supercontig / SO=protein_coding / is_pseudo=false